MFLSLAEDSSSRQTLLLMTVEVIFAKWLLLVSELTMTVTSMMMLSLMMMCLEVFSVLICQSAIKTSSSHSVAECTLIRVNIFSHLHLFDEPRMGPGHPSSPSSIYFIFSPFYVSLSFIGFTYFLLLSIPSLSTRIVPLR